MLPFLVLVSCLLIRLATSKIVTYHWDITWVNASPDGFERPVIGVNGQWPCPDVKADVGDRVIVHVTNCLGNETTSIHWHGLFQTGTNGMDGPVAVTQCPIPVGASFTYDFTINQVGTYWYHSHDKGQYIDGLRGSIIVHDPKAPFASKIDDEFTITLSDWYHDQAPKLINYFQSRANEDNGGSEPIPDGTLMQDTHNAKYHVQPGKTYLVRLINLGAFVGQYVSIDGHKMTIVEIDGVYTEPLETDKIYITVAQRYSVLITTKAHGNANFLIQGAMDSAMFDHVPPGLDINSYGFLVYDSSKPVPPHKPITTSGATDDFSLVPLDHLSPLKVDCQILMNMVFQNISGQNRATINGNTYVPQKVPTLYTALSVGDYATNPKVYGANSNAFVLEYGKVYEIILNNYDGGEHPWHMHGHNFQVIARSPANGAPYSTKNHTIISKYPMRRDTVQVPAGGYIVIRFRADNPGINLFHCHIEWHVEAGLSTTLVEAPLELQKRQTAISNDHIAACRAQGIPTSGNAAGNTKNPLDLKGANTMADPDPWGALVNKPRRRSFIG